MILRNAYWLTLLAAALSVWLMINYLHHAVEIQLSATYFRLGTHLLKEPFMLLARLAVLVFLAESILYGFLRNLFQANYLIPAHTLLSNLLLIGLLVYSPVTHPILVFNLFGFIVLTQLWFIFAMILALRELILRSRR